jgi:hypothetical protein
MYAMAPEEQHFFPSAVSPGPAQKRLALGVVLGLLGVFALISSGLLSGIKTQRMVRRGAMVVSGQRRHADILMRLSARSRSSDESKVHG